MWLLVFLFSTFVKVSVCNCPDSFERHGASCYKVMGIHATWAEAKGYCKVMGSDLLVIDSNTEETLIDGIISSLHGSIRPEQYWIDGSDFMAEGQWRWVLRDGKSEIITGYTNWGPGQPDNSGGKENCLEIQYSGGIHWYDSHCDTHMNFICESSTDTGGSVFG